MEGHLGYLDFTQTEDPYFSPDLEAIVYPEVEQAQAALNPTIVSSDFSGTGKDFTGFSTHCFVIVSAIRDVDQGDGSVTFSIEQSANGTTGWAAIAGFGAISDTDTRYLAFTRSQLHLRITGVVASTPIFAVAGILGSYSPAPMSGNAFALLSPVDIRFDDDSLTVVGDATDTQSLSEYVTIYFYVGDIDNTIDSCTCVIEGSNDGTTWSTVTTGFTPVTSPGMQTASIHRIYRYYRATVTMVTSASGTVEVAVFILG